MKREAATPLLDEGVERWLDSHAEHLTGYASEYWDGKRRKPGVIAGSAAPAAPAR